MISPLLRRPLLAPLLAGLNHLLEQEAWAREQLQIHSAKVASLATDVLEIQILVMPDGMLQAAPEHAVPDVVIRTRMADLPLIMQNRERAFSYVKLEGDADFAQTISHLGQNLRWEAEHDLQHWVGAIAANRMVAGAKAALDAARTGQQKLAENMAEYFLEEEPMLIRPLTLDQFTSDVGKTRDDVERLGKRVEKLAHKIKQGRA